jgi:hypothetical protein
MPMVDDRLAQTFVELADTLGDDFDVIEFLYLLVDRCVTLLDVSATGLLLSDSHDRLEVMACSAENIHLLELFQLQHSPAATESGFRTVHALPMRLRSQVIGTLTLFHTTPNTLAPEVTQIGQAMADVATIGLIQQQSLHQQDILIDQLQTAQDGRVIIEQAKGVLAERHHINPGQAFTLLLNNARKHNQRLTQLATTIIDGTTITTELLRGTPAITQPTNGNQPETPRRQE